MPQEIDGDKPDSWFAQKRSTLAAALVFTAPGIPMLFQGQEFLQGEWFRDDVPLDWHQRDEFRGIVRLYRDLAYLRLNRYGTTRGLGGQFVNVFNVNDAMNMIAFQRWDQHGPQDDVVVVMNFSTEARDGYDIGLPAQGLWRVRFNSDAHHYSQSFANHATEDVQAQNEARDGMPCRGRLNIGPYSAVVLSQDAS